MKRGATIWRFNLHGDIEYIKNKAERYGCVVNKGTQKGKRARGVASGRAAQLAMFKSFLISGV